MPDTPTNAPAQAGKLASEAAKTKTIPHLVLAKAGQEIGNTEIPKGSNWGKHVQKYLKSVGITFPASWCMGFVYWCFSEVFKELEKPLPLFKSGGVLATWNGTDKKYRVVGKPSPGDIFILDFGKGLGHTGIVELVKGDSFMAIEGNSNSTGSREGVEVCRPKWRKIASAKGFLRIGV